MCNVYQTRLRPYTQYDVAIIHYPFYRTGGPDYSFLIISSCPALLGGCGRIALTGGFNVLIAKPIRER